MSNRTCLCGAPVVSKTGVPRCEPCKAETAKVARDRRKDARSAWEDRTCSECEVVFRSRAKAGQATCGKTCSRKRNIRLSGERNRKNTGCCAECGDPKKSRGGVRCKQCADNRRRSERVCSVDGCGRPHAAKGLCYTHRSRAERKLPMEPRLLRGDTEFKRNVTSCPVDGCDRLTFNGRTGLCAAHTERLRDKGDVLAHKPVKNRVGDGGWREWHRNHHGYVVRRRSFDGQWAWQAQHRLVMEQMIGRPLLPQETVHHINGVRDDNRPENLELWSKSQPSGQRVADKVAWAKQIIALYEPEALAAGQQLRLAV